MKQFLILCAAMLVSAMFVSIGAQAQTMSGMKLGDDTVDVTLALGPPTSTNQTFTQKELKWDLPNGNELTVNVNASGKVTYIQTGWADKPDGAKSGMYDFEYGKTTLTEIRAKLGSNGMSYVKRRPLVSLPEGVVLINSYEVGSAILTFYAVVAIEDVAKGRAEAAKGGLALFAKLTSISIATPEYALAEWGEPLYPSGYKRVQAK